MNKRLIMAGLIIAFFFCTPNLFALSPEIRFDMLKTKVVQQLKKQEFTGALETMNEIKALGIPVPSSLDYFEGKALFESGQKSGAYIKLEGYVEQNGKSAKYYNQAIAYLVKAEDTYHAENEKKERELIAREIAAEQARVAAEQARVAAEQRAREEREIERVFRKEAKEFSALPQTDKEFRYTGLMWTLPVPPKYRENPLIPVRVTGTAQEAKTYCESLASDGYDDWKIPTMKEFGTIRGSGTKYSRINWGDNPYYNIWVRGSREFSDSSHTFKENQLYSYATGREGQSSDTNIMCVRIDSQETFDHYFKKEYQVIEHQGNKIMVEDQYMVTDSECYFLDPTMTFDSAVEYCEDLALGGYNDWRVPTNNDLMKKIPCELAYNLQFLSDDSRKSWIWVNKITRFGPSYLNVDECMINTYAWDGDDEHSVRCVRDVEN